MLSHINMTFVDMLGVFKGQNNVDSLKSVSHFDA